MVAVAVRWMVSAWRHGTNSAVIAAIAAIILGAGLLSCVAIANRSPLPFPDSRSYWVGGRIATQIGLGMAERLLHAPAASGRAVAAASEPEQSRNKLRSAAGVRSVFYSLFTYGAGATLSVSAVVVLQGLALACSVFLLGRALVPSLRPREYLVVVLGLCLFTSAPWIAAELLPDVFSGIVIAAAIVLFLGPVSPRGILALAALDAFAITTHTSHFPLALLLLLISLLIGAVSGLSAGRLAGIAARLGLPLAGAVAATLLVSFVGFHQISLAPQSPPFLLARSLQDGPARALLGETCPKSGYVMCHELGAIPKDDADFVWNFLWAPNSIYMSASSEVRERLRHEEIPIVLAAAKRHPLQQATASLTNLLAQAGEFGAYEFHLGGDVSIKNGEYVGDLGATKGPLLDRLTILQYAAVIVALVVLIHALFASPPPRSAWRNAIMLCLAGLLVNAAICGIFSGPSPRYEARVAWLPVALVLMYWIDMLRTRAPAFRASRPACVPAPRQS